MKTIKIWQATAVVLIILYGCSGYQLSSQSKNVIVDTISPNTFTVNFCGNAYMSQKEVEKYALQRASELTLSKGCSHFVILKKRDDSEVCMLSSKERYSSTPPLSDIPTFVKPNITLTIQCFSKGAKIPQDAIDAEQFLHENFPGLPR